LKAYVCPAGIPTIGYGHTSGVKLGMTISKEEAERLLVQDMTIALNATLALCPILKTESPSKIAAIADFTFNLGAGRLKASTLRRRINAGEYEDVPYELSRWVKGLEKGVYVTLPGLVLRRQAEAQLWLSDELSESTTGKESGTTGVSQLFVPFTDLVSGFGGRSTLTTYLKR
jgi:lysozyme